MNERHIKRTKLKQLIYSVRMQSHQNDDSSIRIMCLMMYPGFNIIEAKAKSFILLLHSECRMFRKLWKFNFPNTYLEQFRHNEFMEHNLSNRDTFCKNL